MNYETVKRNAPRGTKKHDNSDYAEKKAKILEIQKNNMKTIDGICAYLESRLTADRNPDDHTKFKISDVVNHFIKQSEDPAFSDESLKAVSQFTYLLIELANARLSKWITGYRINLRIAYIEERLKTIMKKEIHESVDTLIGAYPVLFGWYDEEAEETTDNVENVSSEE